MFLFVLLFIISVVLLILWFRQKSNYWRNKNVVQVNDLFLRFAFEGRSMAEICKDVYDNHDAPYIGTYLGMAKTLILKNREDIQAVMAGDFQSFHSRGIPTNESDLLADNILFMNDFQRWKILRQKLSPVFTTSKLKDMFYIIEKCARDFVDFVDDNHLVRKKPFNVLYTYTTASIGAAVFGIDTQSRNTMDSPFMDMAWKSVNPSMYTNFVVIIANLFPRLFKFLQIKIFGEHEKFFIGAVKSVLEQRRYSTVKRHDFIEICIELQKLGVMQDFTTGFELVPTDELLAAQAFFFFIAGADTTANTMHFTLLELASNPKILTKLHKEVDDVISSLKNPEELTYNDIEKLVYMDQVVNEAMRKYPPIGFIQRICTKDTVLPTDYLKIEKGTAIVIPVYAVHRDEKYYPDPDRFDPERFAPANVSSIPKYAYLPFGEGNRICIGVRFARLQVKAGLAWLLRRFTLEEQSYQPSFEKSPFALRDANAEYKLILRDV